RAGSDERRVARRNRNAILKDGELLRFEDGDGVRHRFQIVQELDRAIAKAVRDYPRVSDPRHIGHARDETRDGAGNADAHGIDAARAGFVEKCRDDFVEIVEVERGVLADDLRLGPLASLAEKPDQGLGAPDVRRKQHDLWIICGNYSGDLTYRHGRFNVTPLVTNTRQPFAGDHVATTGKLTLFSRRDIRTLVERLGGVFTPDITPRTTVLVSATPILDPPPAVRRVLNEDAFCIEAGLPNLETLKSRYYAARDLRTMYPSLREEHLRYLEKWGLIGSVAGRYSFADLHVIRDAVAEIDRGAALPAVLRALDAERQGQLALDFQPTRAAERAPAKVLSLRASGPSRADAPAATSTRAEELAAANQALAAKYFLEGAELDDGENRDLEAAAGAYRRAALFDPHLVPAVVNLANIYYERDELVEAEALYEKAIRLDAECFEAYFNLGNIHHDLGRYAEALAAYRDALAINPAYPEAHFYLAVTLEKLGRSNEARPHWRQYRDLAPDGEFVALATEFSETRE